MNANKIHLLTHIYSNLVAAAGLPEGVRPYSVQSHLTEIQKQIMEEVKNNDVKPTDKPTDDIPF